MWYYLKQLLEGEKREHILLLTQKIFSFRWSMGCGIGAIKKEMLF